MTHRDHDEMDNWPIEAQKEIRRLRSECAQMRIQRNEARQELANRQRSVRGEALFQASRVLGAQPDEAE